MSFKTIFGGCYCSSITYEIQGEVLNQGVCYCSDCQKLTGGSSWPFLFISTDSLKTHGELKTFVRMGRSGKKVKVEFCPECGTTLFGRPEFWQGCMTVSASTLNNPDIFSPKIHVWTKEAPKWTCLHENWTKFLQNP